MARTGPRPPTAFQQRLSGRLGHPQHRTAYYLTLNNIMGSATGLLFWLVLVRVARLDAAVLGVGYAVVALGTVVGVVAKGGLDTAIIQKAPGASRLDGHRLMLFAFAVGAAAAVGLTLLLAAASSSAGLLPHLDALGWALVATTATLLLLTWLHDAYFVALGQPKFCLERNIVLSVGRLALPLPVLALAWVHPIPLTWALALAGSAVAATWRVRRIPHREGRRVPRKEFLGSAMRNVSGGAAEFLPGLLLAPLVLAVDGPQAAAYFGIAWTGASLIFQTSGAIGRSALAQMIHTGPAQTAAAIRKGASQLAWAVLPLSLTAALLAAPLLGIFGPSYTQQGTPVLVLLAVSALLVAPISLYLAVLRARDNSRALLLFPAAMIVSLLALAPALDARYGITGVALAWLLSNLPFGLYAGWRLYVEATGVSPHAGTAPLGHRADVE